jgi:predicted RNA binding protein YcfA (HicA-like mRNA interferase family)
MKLPRNCKGATIAHKLGKFGYSVTRQTGSHLRLTTEKNGQHHVTIPHHSPLKVGTLHGILHDIARHHQTTIEELAELLNL